MKSHAALQFFPESIARWIPRGDQVAVPHRPLGFSKPPGPSKLPMPRPGARPWPHRSSRTKVWRNFGSTNPFATHRVARRRPDWGSCSPGRCLGCRNHWACDLPFSQGRCLFEMNQEWFSKWSRRFFFNCKYWFSMDHINSTFTICSALTRASASVTSQRRSAPRRGQALDEAEKMKKERGDGFEIWWQFGFSSKEAFTELLADRSWLGWQSVERDSVCLGLRWWFHFETTFK